MNELNGQPDLEAILGQGRHSNDKPLRRLPPDVAKARSIEIRRRWTIARNLAQTALRRLHYDDYRALVEQAAAKVDAERGPLPGDEPIETSRNGARRRSGAG
jgi:hypothetical protein